MQIRTLKTDTRLKTRRICWLLTAGYLLLALTWLSPAWAGDRAGTIPSSTWFVDMQQYAGASHGSLSCEVCHKSMTGNGKIHPDPETIHSLKIIIKKDFDYQVCQKCHKNAYKRFMKGEHAIAAAKEKKTGKLSKTGSAPTCGNCHSAHYSLSHLTRTQIGKQMTETCGSCHPDQKLSFLANYHGKTSVNLGYAKAAFCTDCHGAHTTISLKNKDAALTACQRCHPDAAPEFANIIIHDSTKNNDQKNKSKQKGLKWVHGLSLLSFIFVTVVLVFFFTHSGLLMLRKLHEKLRRHK